MQIQGLKQLEFSLTADWRRNCQQSEKRETLFTCNNCLWQCNHLLACL